MRNFYLIFALLASLTVSAAHAGDPVVFFGSDDDEMNAAITDAHASLPAFLSNGFDPSGTGFGNANLKVGLEADTDGGVEHIWVNSLERDGEAFRGRLANEPNFRPDLSYGSEISFDATMISDWSVIVDGQLYGHYTTRVLVSRLPAEQAAPIIEMLSDDPIPSGW